MKQLEIITLTYALVFLGGLMAFPFHFSARPEQPEAITKHQVSKRLSALSKQP
ncbi:hypothetical protein BJX99DRAFT_236261 [Aspergillus californicus]